MKISHASKIGLFRTCSLLVCLALTGAHGAPAKIGVLLGDSTRPFGQAAAEAMRQASEKYGVTIVLKAPLLEENIGMERKILAAWEAEGGFQALIVTAGLNTAEMGEALQPFVKKGVPVVAFLGQFPPGVAKASAQIDEPALTASAVELCAAQSLDGDEIGILRATTPDGKMNERERAFILGLRARHPKSTIHADVFYNADKGKEKDQAKLLLAKYPGMKLVYSPYTVATLAMIEALRETGNATKIRHVGVGTNLPPECIRALSNSELHAWIALIPRDVAFKSVETAVALLEGKTVPEIVSVKARVVTRENLDSPEIKALLRP